MTYTYTHYAYTQYTCAHTFLTAYNSTPGTGFAVKAAQHKRAHVLKRNQRIQMSRYVQ